MSKMICKLTAKQTTYANFIINLLNVMDTVNEPQNVSKV